MKKDNGGAAFPRTGEADVIKTYPHEVHQTGMSLRDYFAAKAMQGELAAQDVRNDGKGTGVLTSKDMSDFAIRCYAIADAMLKVSKL